MALLLWSKAALAAKKNKEKKEKKKKDELATGNSNDFELPAVRSGDLPDIRFFLTGVSQFLPVTHPAPRAYQGKHPLSTNQDHRFWV